MKDHGPARPRARAFAQIGPLALIVAAALACGSEASLTGQGSAAPPPAAAPAPPPPGPPGPAEPAPVRATRPPPVVRPPLGHRVARPPLIVRAEPSHRAKRRGRIEARASFAIYSLHPGPDCAGEGWAAVDHGGFVCLEHAVASETPPRIQPPLLEGRSVPFIYAKPKILDKKTEAIAQVPRYRDRQAFVRGDAPIDYLGPDRQYTFVKTKLRRGGLLLFDADDRVVTAKGLKIAKESSFSGRDLNNDPIPAGLHAAWSVSRPAALYARPERGAPTVGELPYHATLHIDARPITVAAEDIWYAVPTGPDAKAYARAEDVNYWIPGPALAEAAEHELWLDIELGQQTLAVMRGQTPEFITLMSSGAGGSATPRGLFRIYEKLAVSPMRSGPNAEDPYFVDGVPWIQYFHRRYALHTSYWHDDFGKRRSHGCVNLAPKDAALIYALTTPVVPPGWNSMYEHPGAAGTLVRVRKGDETVPDLRLPLGVIKEEDETTDATQSAPDDPSAPAAQRFDAGP